MNQLQEIRKGLKHGDIKAIHNETGFSQSYISDVLRERVPANEKIIALAAELVAINKENTKKLNVRIKKILSK